MISLYGNNKVLDYYISCMLYMAYMISDIMPYHIGGTYDRVYEMSTMWVIYLTIKAVILAILGVWFELYIEKMSKYKKRGCA